MAVQAGASTSLRRLTRTDGAGDGENSLSRLTQLEAILSGGESEKDVLENGPAQPGQGLNQAEIDAWLDGAG